MVVQWSIPVWNLFFFFFFPLIFVYYVVWFFSVFSSCLVGFLESFMGGPWAWTVYLFPLAILVNVFLLNNEKLKVNHTIVWEAGDHFGTRNMLVLCLNIYIFGEPSITKAYSVMKWFNSAYKAHMTNWYYSYHSTNLNRFNKIATSRQHTSPSIFARGQSSKFAF